MWPFKRRRSEPDVWAHVETSDGWLRIDSLAFFGQYSSPPDGRHTIGWSDSDPSGHQSGFRETGYGSYVLLFDNQVLLRGRMERPNDGRVSNTGTFVLND